MKTFLAIIFFSSTLMVSGQELRQVNFSGGQDLVAFTFLVDYDLLVRISPEGEIMEWGTEVMSDRYFIYAPKLQPYLGPVEYYGDEADSLSKGKLKIIGSCKLYYYGAYGAEKSGKIQKFGSLLFDYYDSFGDKQMQGKLRILGNVMLEYYSHFEDPALRGKLKSVGGTRINYYSSFDDKLLTGKIKSIGPYNYAWYGTFDKTEWRGALKSGLERVTVGRVVYTLR